jgi:hypothetical protein
MDIKTFHNDNIFYFNDSLLVEAPALITKFLIIKNFVILLIDSNELRDDKNIFCYSLKGQFEWQIREVPKLPSHTRNYYTSIYVNENNDLQAYNLNGVEVTINLSNGEIIKKELIR